LLRTIVREAGQNFASYATASRGGSVAVGAEVLIE
jgi:hypothetical protein